MRPPLPPPFANIVPAGVLTGIALCGALCGCAGDAAPPAAATAADSLAGPGAAGERPTQQIFDYRLVESDAGVKQWILQSEEMRKYGGQRDMVLSEVHMDFFQDGAHFSVLVADSGTANTVTKQVFTWGNVVVTTDDGRRLETEELHFDDKSGLIHNDVFNRFTRRADVMTGFGLEATPDLEYIELKRDVKAAVTDTTDLARPAPGSGKEGP